MVITEKSVQRVENVETVQKMQKKKKKRENTSLQTKLFRIREGAQFLQWLPHQTL